MAGEAGGRKTKEKCAGVDGDDEEGTMGRGGEWEVVASSV